MTDRLRFLTSLLCLVLLPFAILAEDTKAILTPTGQVTVNGKAVSKPTPIFEGDKIETGADASAAISTPGSTTTLGANSSLSYGSKSISFGCGSAAIASNGTPLTAVVNGIEVGFGTQPAQVQISDTGGVMLVKTVSGSAQVKEAGSASTLAEGFSVARPGSSACATPGGTETATAAKSHSSTALLLGILAVGGIAGAALGAKGGGSNNSPTTTPSPSVSSSVP